MSVRVRFPSGAHQSLLEEIPRGIFVFFELYIGTSEGSVAKVCVLINRWHFVQINIMVMTDVRKILYSPVHP